MTLNTQWAIAWMKETAHQVNIHRDELIDLDRQIGDADHGENLDRGFAAVVDAIAQAELATPADVLKLTARTLISTVGGASGPLLGTAFLRASKAVGTAEELDSAAAAALFAGGFEGITARGKATEGEKTMLDAWGPALRAAQQAADQGKTPLEVLEAAAQAAAEGAQATIPMLATKGRASYLGDRSIGHEDPGAASSALIIQAAASAAKGE